MTAVEAGVIERAAAAPARGKKGIAVGLHVRQIRIAAAHSQMHRNRSRHLRQKAGTRRLAAAIADQRRQNARTDAVSGEAADIRRGAALLQRQIVHDVGAGGKAPAVDTAAVDVVMRGHIFDHGLERRIVHARHPASGGSRSHGCDDHELAAIRRGSPVRAQRLRRRGCGACATCAMQHHQQRHRFDEGIARRHVQVIGTPLPADEHAARLRARISATTAAGRFAVSRIATRLEAIGKKWRHAGTAHPGRQTAGGCGLGRSGNHGGDDGHADAGKSSRRHAGTVEPLRWRHKPFAL